MTTLDRAVALLGPLEGRIMRHVWTGAVREPFVVRDLQVLMPQLAYTTVMTTLNRLAGKHLLQVERIPGQRAYGYLVALWPDAFLARESRDQVERVVEQFGDAALAAFAERLDTINPDQLERLRKLARQ